MTENDPKQFPDARVLAADLNAAMDEIFDQIGWVFMGDGSSEFIVRQQISESFGRVLAKHGLLPPQ